MQRLSIVNVLVYILKFEVDFLTIHGKRKTIWHSLIDLEYYALRK